MQMSAAEPEPNMPGLTGWMWPGLAVILLLVGLPHGFPLTAIAALWGLAQVRRNSDPAVRKRWILYTVVSAVLTAYLVFHFAVLTPWGEPVVQPTVSTPWELRN